MRCRTVLTAMMMWLAVGSVQANWITLDYPGATSTSAKSIDGNRVVGHEQRPGPNNCRFSPSPSQLHHPTLFKFSLKPQTTKLKSQPKTQITKIRIRINSFISAHSCKLVVPFLNSPKNLKQQN